MSIKKKKLVNYVATRGRLLKMETVNREAGIRERERETRRVKWFLRCLSDLEMAFPFLACVHFHIKSMFPKKSTTTAFNIGTCVVVLFHILHAHSPPE